MQFDFTTMLDRVGKDAIAIEMLGMPGGFAPGAPKPGYDAIPMWVADMNFPTAPSVVSAILERAEHPAFGYFMPTKAYYDAIIGWHERRHGVTGIAPEHIGYQNGVLGGLASACGAFTSPGDRVLVNSPTYIGFEHAIERCGRFLERSPLVRDDEGVWRMDYDDMDRRIREQHISLAVLCSPFNPCGRVWERWELERAAEVFERNDVVVVADEIWSDLVFGDNVHIPFHTVCEDARMRTVTFNAPSKTFNLAGLQISNIFIENESMRQKFRATIDHAGYSQPNALGMFAAQAAYEKGLPWLEALRDYLEQNYQKTKAFLAQHLPKVTLIEPEGTYLLWLDFRAYGLSAKELDHLIVHEANLWLDSGHIFGKDGEGFERLNIACPWATLEQGLKQLARTFKNR